MQGNWYGALLLGQVFDLIVANPPYIAHCDPHLQQGDLRFEPRAALTDGLDGLRAIEHIVVGARSHLKFGGTLWLEHAWDQAQAVRQMLAQAGFALFASRRDLAGIERISGGCCAASAAFSAEVST
jgi:release factor glutamine methyltransferase